MNIYPEHQTLLSGAQDIAVGAGSIILQHVPPEAREALGAALLAELNARGKQEGFGMLGDAFFTGLLWGLGWKLEPITAK